MELIQKKRLSCVRHALEGLLGDQTVVIEPKDFRYAFYQGAGKKKKHRFTVYGKATTKDLAPLPELKGHSVETDLECCNVFHMEASCSKSKETGTLPQTPLSDTSTDTGSVTVMSEMNLSAIHNASTVMNGLHLIKAFHPNLPDEILTAGDAMHDWLSELMQTPEAQKILKETQMTEQRTVVKNEDGSMDLFIPFAKVDEEQRVVYGVVYEPDTVDAQGDHATGEEIRKACHGYMMNSRRTGLMHKDDITEKAPAVENYLAPNDMIIGNQRVKKGSWIMAHKIHDDGIWKDIKEGRLTGLSMSGKAVASVS